MKSIYVNGLLKNQLISNETFVIHEVEKLQDKNGRDYYNLSIGDKTGKISAKIWGDNIQFVETPAIKSGKVVQISAKVEDYKGKLQLNISQLNSIDENSLEEYLESSEYSADQMIEDLKTYLESIQNPDLKKVVMAIFNDSEINKRLKYWPAASNVHHAFRSGLIQHILEMLEVANSMRKYYPDADYDVLNAGIFLHDIGKLYELDGNGVSTSYTAEGTLIGHIVKGVMIFTDFGGKSLPKDLYMHIVHMILSHHGTQEFGSPVVPSTLEAVILSRIDDLSAKSRSADKARKSIPKGQEFGQSVYWLENARMWRGPATDEKIPLLSI